MDDQTPCKRQKLDAEGQMTALEEPKEAPTLLTLPGGIRNHIYKYLHRDAKAKRRFSLQTRVCYIPTSTETDPHQRCGFENLTRVCHDLRAEFLPFLLSRITILTPLHMIESSVKCFGSDLKRTNIRGSLTLRVCPPYFCNHEVDKTAKYDLKPFLDLVLEAFLEAPKLKLRVEFFCCCEHSRCSEAPDFFDCDRQPDFDLLRRLARQNQYWAHELRTKIESAMFYPFTPPEAFYQSDTAMCLELVYKKQHKELWMDCPWRDGDLRAYLKKTGLADLEFLDVLVGRVFWHT